MLLQVNFIGKWRLKNNHSYVWTTCNRLVNLKTGKLVKKTTNGRGVKVGYYIDRKFIKQEDIKSNKLIELIPLKPKMPF